MADKIRIMRDRTFGGKPCCLCRGTIKVLQTYVINDDESLRHADRTKCDNYVEPENAEQAKG